MNYNDYFKPYFANNTFGHADYARLIGDGLVNVATGYPNAHPNGTALLFIMKDLGYIHSRGRDNLTLTNKGLDMLLKLRGQALDKPRKNAARKSEPLAAEATAPDVKPKKEVATDEITKATKKILEAFMEKAGVIPGSAPVPASLFYNKFLAFVDKGNYPFRPTINAFGRVASKKFHRIFKDKGVHYLLNGHLN